MILFLLKTLVAGLMIYLTLCFYGNIEEHLFIKLTFCIIFLLTMYWVDIYRLSRIFGTYFIALNSVRKKNWSKAYTLFERLLQSNFAPSLPYLALMKFQGLGTSINIDAAKYYSERAVRNDYFECLYILAVVNFFGNSLSGYFKAQNHYEEPAKEPSQKPQKLKNTYEEQKPDYPEAIFHLRQYLQTNNQKDKYYPEALALLAYCYLTGKGVEIDEKEGNKYLELAEHAHSKNLSHILSCLKNNKEISQYII